MHLVDKNLLFQLFVLLLIIYKIKYYMNLMICCKSSNNPFKFLYLKNVGICSIVCSIKGWNFLPPPWQVQAQVEGLSFLSVNRFRAASRNPFFWSGSLWYFLRHSFQEGMCTSLFRRVIDILQNSGFLLWPRPWAGAEHGGFVLVAENHIICLLM